MQRLLAAERAYVDRAQQAAAIRWATNWLGQAGHVAAADSLLELADRVEAGEVTVPLVGAGYAAGSGGGERVK